MIWALGSLGICFEVKGLHFKVTHAQETCLYFHLEGDNISSLVEVFFTCLFLLELPYTHFWFKLLFSVDGDADAAVETRI